MNGLEELRSLRVWVACRRQIAINLGAEAEGTDDDLTVDMASAAQQEAETILFEIQRRIAAIVEARRV